MEQIKKYSSSDNIILLQAYCDTDFAGDLQIRQNTNILFSMEEESETDVYEGNH